MPALAERLSKRFEEEICRVCVLRTEDEQCAMHPGMQCPIFRWAEDLAGVVERMQSDRLADYLDEIQAIVCPQCVQDPSGNCRQRDDLDCPLDLYLGLVVRILEEELQAEDTPSREGDAP